MTELNQGENYEGEDAEVSENPRSQGVFQIKYLAIIGVTALVLVSALILYFTIGKDSDVEDVTNDDDDWEYSEDSSVDDFDSYFSDSGVDDSNSYDTNTSYYSDEQKRSLRSLGYTGDEIDFYSSISMDYDSLKESAIRDIEIRQEEVLNQLADKSSNAYKTLLNKTWLGGKKLNMDDRDPTAGVETTLHQENVDYEKLSPHNTQLILKLTFPDKKVAFMSVEPLRWRMMKKKGNMVVSYTVHRYNNQDIYTDIQEIYSGDYDQQYEDNSTITDDNYGETDTDAS